MCIHKWGKWGTPYAGTTSQLHDYDVYPVVVQERVCEKCGAAQVQSIWVGTLEGYTPDEG